jgi:phosphate transport system ATP-binding protein
VPHPDAEPSVVHLVGSERERAVHRGGAVVQLVQGDLTAGDATVVEVHPATIVVTSERLVAAEGDLEWSWLLGDIEAVHHGRTEPWTIVTVPGVADHGVSVAVDDVFAFRRALDAALRGEAPVRESIVDESVPASSDSDVSTTATPGAETLAPEEPASIGLVTVADLEGDEALLLPPPPPPPPPTIDLADEPGPADLAPPPPDDERRPEKSRFRGLRDRGRPTSAPTTVSPLAGLEAREISAWFGTHHVLDRVSLMMEPGEVTALIGPSGCGKSTFLRILNRMHEMIPIASLSGEVLLEGEDIYDAQKKLTDARRQIGMVFQKPNPFPAMSIYDNVVASYRLTGTKISSSEKDDVVETCLTKAGLWTEVRDRLRAPGGGLSGGQQQRLCIARALAIKPRVLLMDEPCSALDPTSTRRIEETIMEIGSEVTIVIVTHNMQQAARVSNQCTFFLAEQGTPGVIVEHGPTDAMFNSPQDPRTFDYVNGRFG